MYVEGDSGEKKEGNKMIYMSVVSYRMSVCLSKFFVLNLFFFCLFHLKFSFIFHSFFCESLINLFPIKTMNC